MVDRARAAPGALLEEHGMANVVKVSWFGNQISVLMINGKTITGELTETSDNYIVVSRGGSEVQIMVHAIVMVVPAATKDSKAAQTGEPADSGPELFG
jgi:sRNA-binding regulator protein Hfq